MKSLNNNNNNTHESFSFWKREGKKLLTSLGKKATKTGKGIIDSNGKMRHISRVLWL